MNSANIENLCSRGFHSPGVALEEEPGSWDDCMEQAQLSLPPRREPGDRKSVFKLLSLWGLLAGTVGLP